MHKRYVSMVHKVDIYNFVDVTSKYKIELSYTGNEITISSTEPLFASVSSIFQTDNYFTVVIKYKDSTFYVSINKVNAISGSELCLVQSLSGYSIMLNIVEIPYH